MVIRKFGLLLAAVMLMGADAPATDAQPQKLPEAPHRASALITRFNRFCIQKAPNFERVDKIAAQYGWKVHTEREPPLPGGVKIHSKSWYLKDDTGLYELGISTADEEDGKHTESCGIGAPDAESPAIREELMKTLKLGDPSKETDSADGRRVLDFWKSTAAGTPITIMLTHDKAEGSQGVFINAYVKSESPKTGDAKP